MPVVALAVGLTLAAAAPAMATRYASPNGSPTDPTCAETAPCTLPRALAVSTSGEEVVVAQGDYHVKPPSVLNCTAPAEPSFDEGTAVSVGNRNVHGVAGRPRPRIIGDATSCAVLKISGAGRAEHLEVIGNNTSRAEAAAVVIDGSGRATNLLTGGPNGTVHMRNGAELRNSVAGARPQDGAAVFLHFGLNASAGFINHVTALGTVVADSTSAWGGPLASHIVCVNSIATGGFVARQTNTFSGSQSHVDRSNCAGPASVVGGPNADTINRGGSIQSATLIPGDYHQAGTSPTVNAGRVDPATLDLSDIDGGARTIGPLPDIGADEFGAASALVDSGAVQSVSGAAAVVAGAVFPGGLPTSVYVEYGPTTGYGSQSAPAIADGFGRVALTLALTGMTVNSPVYHYRLVGTNGNTRGEDRVIAFADSDGDGFFANADCNDGNAAISPGRGDAPDNGIDDDCSGADAVNLDRDGDGFPRPLDCDDANAAINPGATDLPGNRTDEDCKNGDTPYPTLTSTLGYATTNYTRYTVIDDLFVRRARRGSTIRINCTGRGCPFKSKSVAVRRDAARLSLKTALRRARLRAGTKVRVRLTFPQTIGLETTLTMRPNRKNPTRVDRCLVPGATRSSRCAG